ncbi:MAG: DMT family protein [Candidatus Caenarcaniphilales bacterium]|nr:DMT family protein [Candidatus Caenarcaniphilales bacterium]
MKTIILLILSNIFMTFAWYGHLRFTETSLWKVILISWGIAFFEYCLQVPANRAGYGIFNSFQLKIIQEVITILVFVVFSIFYLKSAPQWNHSVSFLMILGAVYFAFLKI